MHNSCLLVIHGGDIAEWKADKKGDAVVSPYGRRRSRWLTEEGGLSLRSTHRASGNISMTSLKTGADVFGKGRGLSSMRSSGKIISSRDQTVKRNYGGVAVALHQAAGPELQAALQKGVHFAAGTGRCGDAVITPGFKLPASHIIHTFAPVYRRCNAASSYDLLQKTYKSALTLAVHNGICYLAFPAILCGGGGFPLEAAARAALQAVSSVNAGEMVEIHFVLHDGNALAEWTAQADAYPDSRLYWGGFLVPAE